MTDHGSGEVVCGANGRGGSTCWLSITGDIPGQLHEVLQGTFCRAGSRYLVGANQKLATAVLYRPWWHAGSLIFVEDPMWALTPHMSCLRRRQGLALWSLSCLQDGVEGTGVRASITMHQDPR